MSKVTVRDSKGGLNVTIPKSITDLKAGKRARPWSSGNTVALSV
ncbi:hypothetical protein [uncultured Methanomethylovorans sp.]|nr:hypothetical protein [uncultured Methanomethylovorans sp.]